MNKFVKRSIAGAIVGGTIVSFGISTYNLINDGKFELIKNKDSQIATHQYIKTTINSYEKEHEVSYVSRYDEKSKINQKDCFEFTKPGVSGNSGFKAEYETYYLDNISDKEAMALIKNVDLNNSEDLTVLKSLLLKMGAHKADNICSSISESEYQKNYASKNVVNNVTFYSFKQDYSKSKLQTIDPKELEMYNKNVIFQMCLGGMIGALISGGSYVLLQEKKKAKRKVR